MNIRNAFAAAAALAISVFTAADVYAQSASASVSSNVVIETPLSASATAPLAFGTISKGTTATVAATGASAGAVTFSGDEADNITITLPATAVISTRSGDGTEMTVLINRSQLRANVHNTQSSAAILNAGSGSVTTPLSNDNSGDGVVDGLGQLYIWIGGSVTPATTQQRGTYSGTFTVSAAYSN